jgi:hypothetical protein
MDGAFVCCNGVLGLRRATSRRLRGYPWGSSVIERLQRIAMFVADIGTFPRSESKVVAKNFATQLCKCYAKAGDRGFLSLDSILLRESARKWFAVGPLSPTVQLRDVNAKIRLQSEPLKDGGTAHAIEKNDVPVLELTVNALCEFRDPDMGNVGTLVANHVRIDAHVSCWH